MKEFETGSVRDSQAGKPRIDLIPPLWIRRLGVHFAMGAERYGDNNWQQGQPLSQYYTSGMRHMLAWFEGQEDEDHFAAAMWNVGAAMWTLDEVKAGRLPGYLDDRLIYFELARAADMQRGSGTESLEPETFEPVAFVPPPYEANKMAKCDVCGRCCCERHWNNRARLWCTCERPEVSVG